MNDSNTNCPKCQGEMEQGFIVDYKDNVVSKPAVWVEGAPVKSFWSGTKITDKQQYQVRTFRCARCGFLESYANEADYK